MTDVDGPPVPALRFSSLLIRGAEAADFASTDGQALKVDCNVAQAFEIQQGVTGAHPGPFAIGSGVSHPQSTQQRISRSPLPVRPVGRIGIWNMGLPPDRRKRIDIALARPATGPIHGSAIRTKVNRSCRVLQRT